jgi:type I restriction enzyme M protein
LFHHFNRYPLANDDFEFPDLLGAACEYLNKYFADRAGKKSREFHTPSPVFRLLVHINKPQQGQYVYDPACVSAQCPLLDGSAAYDQQLHRVHIK